MNNFLHSNILLLSPDPYRIAAPVSQIVCLPCGDSFPACPTCKISMEREYQAFCDRCGQKLSWKNFSKTKIIRPDYPDPAHI